MSAPPALYAPARAATAHPAPSCTAAPTWRELAAHRAGLVRFARRRLHDPALAEDLVHDVFEAVASGRARFEGRASLRGWLIAILRHKIVDLIRQRAVLASLDADERDDGSGQAFVCPQPLPDEVAEQRQRLAQVMQRLAALPEPLRRTVELRLLADAPTPEVCEALGISASNLFVRLHRARALLAA